jgi:DNA-binding NarL/FixJ family response regulator
VADDVLFTRAGLVRLLADAGCEVVGEAHDLDSALRETFVNRPDVVVLDIRMPPTHTDEGLVAAARIGADLPGTGVLVLSSYVEPSYAMRLIEEHPEGAGYLLKERVADTAVLVDALNRITAGECVVDPTIVALLVGRRRRSDPLHVLTAREKEVLGLLAEGLSNCAVAERITVTERTVEAHTKLIFQKLGLDADPRSNRRVQAVLAYLRSST